LTPEQIEQLVTRSRAACGLPPRVEDPATLDRLMAILAAAPLDRRGQETVSNG
jgi:hypothetical protein